MQPGILALSIGWVCEALDRFDADDTFVLGLVGQHRWAGNVADRIDAVYMEVRPRPSVTMQPRSVLTPSSSSPRPSMLPWTPTAEIRRSASTVCGLAGTKVDRRAHACASLFDLFNLGAGQASSCPAFESLGGKVGDLCVFDRQDLRHQFDDGYVGAHRAIERCELDADGA